MSTAPAGTILVPLDGSRFAEDALPLALSIARATRRRIQLCHVRLLPLWPEEVVGLDTAEAMRRILDAEGESYLRKVQQRLRSPDVTVEATILPGDVVSAGEVLSRYVAEHPVDCVVMATHGLGGVRRAWLGSVADYLIRHLAVPVLLVRPGMDLRVGEQRILVPLDGSPLSEAAIPTACELALALARDVVLLRVISPVIHPMTALDLPYPGIDMNLTAMVRADAEQYLLTVADRVIARGIRCHRIVMLEAGTAECIADMARPGGFSMVVMSTHGRGGLPRLILGSVADKVVRSADVPVMVCPVRTGGMEPARQKQAAPASCTIQ